MSTNTFRRDAPVQIVFLDDDLVFAAGICRELSALGYGVTHFKTGQACLAHLINHDHDLCLLDWQVPDMEGTEVMARLKKSNHTSPIIFMTGNDSESDIAKVLTAGADDYIIKPPSIAVLHARIQALLRRTQQQAGQVQNEKLGPLSIDYKNKVILLNGTPVALTGTEAMLAFDLLAQRGRLVTRQYLYALLGIKDLSIDTRRLDVHISHLRSKLALNAANGWKLSSVYQRGYRLEFFGNAY